MANNVFERVEKKYMLSQTQLHALQKAFASRLIQDAYGLHTINNIYYDTDDYAIIRESIEKPIYKEKLRLRSYGTPNPDSVVYLELKKKFDGIVYKRRVEMTLREANDYISKGIHPAHSGQILREIDWFVGRIAPSPKVCIAYDRVALYGQENPALRVTFDENIRFRATQLDLSKGSWGTSLLPPGQTLMELKIPGAMPVWLARALSGAEVTPVSFSKYGTIYKEHLIHTITQSGGFAHVS